MKPKIICYNVLSNVTQDPVTFFAWGFTPLILLVAGFGSVLIIFLWLLNYSKKHNEKEKNENA